MRYALMTSIPVAVVLANTAAAQERPSITVAETRPPRAVRVEATIQAPLSEVWRVWTTSQGAEEFFAEKANIQLAIGGPYEIQFDPNDERSGTKGLKILSYAPEEMISFQWNVPPEYPEVRNGGTWVVVQMLPRGQTGRTSRWSILAGRKVQSGIGRTPTSSVGGPPAQVVVEIGFQNATEGTFVEHHDVVEAFAAYGADEALSVWILPR